jgi:hypothetical protein
MLGCLLISALPVESINHLTAFFIGSRRSGQAGSGVFRECPYPSLIEMVAGLAGTLPVQLAEVSSLNVVSLMW